MTFIAKVIAAFNIKTKDGDVKIQGPKWVKPSFKTFVEEFKNEDQEWFDNINKADPSAMKRLYDNAKTEIIPADEVKKLDVSDPESDVPVEWLLDPKAKPNFKWGDNTYRYSSRHHEDVLKAFRDGGELDMPIYYSSGVTISGRHRVTYARSLKIPITIMTIDAEEAEDLMEQGSA